MTAEGLDRINVQNDPVNLIDPTGEFAHILGGAAGGAIGGAFVGGIFGAVKGYIKSGGDWGVVASSALSGALLGGAAGAIAGGLVASGLPGLSAGLYDSTATAFWGGFNVALGTYAPNPLITGASFFASILSFPEDAEGSSVSSPCK